MRNTQRRMAVLLACLGIAGCAGIGASEPSADGRGHVRTPTGEQLSPQRAMERILPGTSSRADVSATLGSAIVVPFDNGHEVWIYRWPGTDRTTRSSAELVLLFDPSGTVRKARVRPGYPPRRQCCVRQAEKGRADTVRRRGPGA